MRFLHTSDWHLGRVLCGERLIDDQRHVLAQLIAIAREFRPAAVLVAGDVYDRAVPPPDAVRLLDEVLSELVLDLGVDVVMIAGNHDSAPRLSFGSRILARNRVHVAGSLRDGPYVLRLHDDAGEVAFCSVPYAEPAVVAEELASDAVRDHDSAMRGAIAQIRGVAPAGRAVLMAHAFVPGSIESESERSLTVGGTGAVGPDAFEGFQYVALGHLHRPQAVGREGVRYAGSIHRYAFSEEGHEKSVELVEMDAAGACRVERVVLRPRREVRTMTGLFDELLRRPRGEGQEDLLSITLEDANPILDARSRLAEVYPNVLEVQQPNFLRSVGAPVAQANYRSMEDGELFRAFFEQVTGREMTGEEATELTAALETLRVAAAEEGR